MIEINYNEEHSHRSECPTRYVKRSGSRLVLHQKNHTTTAHWIYCEERGKCSHGVFVFCSLTRHDNWKWKSGGEKAECECWVRVTGDGLSAGVANIAARRNNQTCAKIASKPGLGGVTAGGSGASLRHCLLLLPTRESAASHHFLLPHCPILGMVVIAASWSGSLTASHRPAVLPGGS